MMPDANTILTRISAVAIDGRALAMTGPPGTGKSSLALALIDRGARLIGDDAISLTREGERLIADSPPNIAGLIEIVGVGLAQYPVAPPSPLALVLDLEARSDRLPDAVATREWLGIAVPVLAFDPGTIAPAVRAERALAMHGLIERAQNKSLP